MEHKIISEEINLYREFKMLYGPLSLKYGPRAFLSIAKDTSAGFFHPTPVDELCLMARSLPLHKFSKLIDLGSGLATVLIIFAIHGLEGLGYETDEMLLRDSRKVVAHFQKIYPRMAAVTLTKKDFFEHPFPQSSGPLLIYYYENHLHERFAALAELIRKYAPPGSLFVFRGLPTVAFEKAGLKRIQVLDPRRDFTLLNFFQAPGAG